MDREELLRILDKLPEDRTPEEAACLEAGVEASPEFAHLVQAVEGTIEAWQEAPRAIPPDTVLEALWRRVDQESRSADVSIEVGKGCPETGGGASRRTHRWLDLLLGSFRPVMVGALGVVAALLVWTFRTGNLEDIRTKGPGEVAMAPTVDLQVVIESAGGRAHRPAEDLATLRPGDGLFFRFVVERAGFLGLVERDPMHRLSLIYERNGLDRAAGETVIDIVDDQGRHLRFVPPDTPGEYTYIAVASERPPGDDLAGWLDSVWARYAARYRDVLAPDTLVDMDLDAIRLVVEAPSGQESDDGGAP